MQEMRELVVKAPDIVKEKLLELLQTWAYAFRQTPKYRAVQVSRCWWRVSVVFLYFF